MATVDREIINDDLDDLLNVLPEPIDKWISEYADLDQIIEIVLDYGREPEVRYFDFSIYMEGYRVTDSDLQTILQSNKLGTFGVDNRAGIEQTLHRISAIRNRTGEIDGITMRVGRIISGTIDLVQDIVDSGESVLFLGKPGVGKTSKLRDAAHYLSVDKDKRVIIVDSSNEIAGESRYPHRAVGRSRRMMVPFGRQQHEVMIEAVENHMPDVIIIDEISTYEEAMAARTIAERGVQLLASAHGDTIDNLVTNPPMGPLLGNLKTSALSDDEARRRGLARKQVTERSNPPTFNKLVELRDFDKVAVYSDVAKAVDTILLGIDPQPEIRVWKDGGIKKLQTEKYGRPQTEETNTIRSVARLIPRGQPRQARQKRNRR